MRAIFAAIFVVALLSVAPDRAQAASACTAWVDYDGNQDACMSMLRNRTKDEGITGSRTESTYFFWFGSNVVTARCITGRGIVALASYHSRDGQACPLLDRVKNAISR
jgi:hypothetical protein